MLKVLYTVKTNDGTKKGAKEVDLVAKLFDEIAPKYADRNPHLRKQMGVFILKVRIRDGFADADF